MLLIEDGHAFHATLEVIKLAKNDVHLVLHSGSHYPPTAASCYGCVEATEVIFFEGLQAIFCTNPGRVITTEVSVSLLGQAWPELLTPVNVMSGFKKGGI